MHHDLSLVLRHTETLPEELAPVGDALSYVARVAATREIRMSPSGARQLLHERLDAIAAGEDEAATAARRALLHVDGEDEAVVSALGVVLRAAQAAGS